MPEMLQYSFMVRALLGAAMVGVLAPAFDPEDGLINSALKFIADANEYDEDGVTRRSLSLLLLVCSGMYWHDAHWCDHQIR